MTTQREGKARPEAGWAAEEGAAMVRPPREFAPRRRGRSATATDAGCAGSRPTSPRQCQQRSHLVADEGSPFTASASALRTSAPEVMSTNFSRRPARTAVQVACLTCTLTSACSDEPAARCACVVALLTGPGLSPLPRNMYLLTARFRVASPMPSVRFWGVSGNIREVGCCLGVPNCQASSAVKSSAAPSGAESHA